MKRINGGKEEREKGLNSVESLYLIFVFMYYLDPERI